jgi:DNA-binding Lrp family transcriptional regulator
MRRRIERPRILLLDCPLEYKKGESQTNVEIMKEEDFNALLRQEEEYVEQICAQVRGARCPFEQAIMSFVFDRFISSSVNILSQVVAHRPDLVITEKGVSDLASHYFVKAGITCLRRVKRLTDGGWIERQIAVLSPARLGASLGHIVSALVVVSLGAQGVERLDAFEARAVADDAVQQCWRLSSGPDFILVVQALSMPDYLDVTRRLFTQDANVRNVKAFFSIKRSKFSAALPLPNP